MLPVTEAIYDFRTDVRTDINTVTTAPVVFTGNITLFTNLYDNDTSTITISSDDSDDSPVYSSYNTTTRRLIFSGLDDNTTRTMTVLYDIDALTESEAVGNLMDMVDFLWLLILVAFPGAAIVAIFVGRA